MHTQEYTAENLYIQPHTPKHKHNCHLFTYHTASTGTADVATSLQNVYQILLIICNENIDIEIQKI